MGHVGRGQAARVRATHGHLASGESENLMRSAADEQLGLWDQLIADVWTYRRTLEKELTGRDKPLLNGEPPDWIIHG